MTPYVSRAVPGPIGVSGLSGRDLAVLFLSVTLLFVAIHLAFAFYDAGHPDAFMEGDRAFSRAEKIMQFQAAAGDRLAFVYQAGPPGDYIAHAVLQALGGRPLVVLTQVLLTLGSVWAAMVIVLRLDGRAWPTALAGVFACAASGMLMNAHMLVTEPWSTFALTTGCLLCTLALLGERPAMLYAGFLCFAAASFFRPSNLLVPALAALALVVFCRSFFRKALGPMIVSYVAFPGLWIGLRFFGTGQIGLGPSDFDLERNYWLRASRVAMPHDAFDPYVNLLKMPLRPFLSVVAAHPVATLKTVVADAANLLFNPGTNQVFGQYLHLVSTPDDKWFFRNLLDSEGLVAVLQQIRAMGFGFVAVFLIFMCLQLVIVAGYVVLPFVLARFRRGSTQPAAFLLVVTAASLLAVFAAGGVRWSQRSNVEPVGAALAALTIGYLLQEKGTLRDRFTVPIRQG